VVGDKKVRLGEEELSFTPATQKALGFDRAVRPAPLWRFNGRLLSEMYEETYTE
jgi:hypothetical protein